MHLSDILTAALIVTGVDVLESPTMAEFEEGSQHPFRATTYVLKAVLLIEHWHIGMSIKHLERVFRRTKGTISVHRTEMLNLMESNAYYEKVVQPYIQSIENVAVIISEKGFFTANKTCNHVKYDGTAESLAAISSMCVHMNLWLTPPRNVEQKPPQVIDVLSNGDIRIATSIKNDGVTREAIVTKGHYVAKLGTGKLIVIDELSGDREFFGR